MLSEWLVDVPSDLEENWLVKPCPKGQRMMVVATQVFKSIIHVKYMPLPVCPFPHILCMFSQGTTKAYTKSGYVVATFSSALPSGNRSSRQGITILDCIWDYENRTYYVLDVLAWNNIELLDCEVNILISLVSCHLHIMNAVLI